MNLLKIELSNRREHLCGCYNNSGKDSLIDKVSLHYMQEYRWESSFAQICMVYKGKISFRLRRHEVTAGEGNLFLLPTGSVSLCARAQSQLVCFSLQEGVNFCPSLPLEQLADYMSEIHEDSYKTGVHLLAANPAIECYLAGLLPFLESGLRCKEYLQGKVRELLFYLRGYYPKEELAAFFSAVLSEDFIFRSRVYGCLRNNLKVGELSQELGMCYAKLIGRFYQVFGISPKEFIDNYKKEHLLYDLKCGIKPLKTLPYEYGFSSYSALTRYCIAHLGARPTDLRTKK